MKSFESSKGSLGRLRESSKGLFGNTGEDGPTAGLAPGATGGGIGDPAIGTAGAT